LYLGLACISWGVDRPEGQEQQPTGMRPECRELRGSAGPWMVRSLTGADIPRDQAGGPWTFHVLSLDEPFGFFEPCMPTVHDGGSPQRGSFCSPSRWRCDSPWCFGLDPPRAGPTNGTPCGTRGACSSSAATPATSCALPCSTTPARHSSRDSTSSAGSRGR